MELLERLTVGSTLVLEDGKEATPIQSVSDSFSALVMATSSGVSIMSVTEVRLVVAKTLTHANPHQTI